MATAMNSSSTFPSYDRSTATGTTDDTPLSSQAHRLGSANSSTTTYRQPGQHLDDADLLAWKRQYANISLREQNMMSNSAEDLTQLIDRIPYHFDMVGNEYNDMDDDEIHFDNSAGYDYDAVIRERLKKANEELQHDDTPSELKHRQRVSFDANVKAVDIVQDPAEYTDVNPSVGRLVSPVAEEPAPVDFDSKDETSPHPYTVPLNDTQPRDGPSLVDKLRAVQFHGATIPPGERWTSTKSSSTTNNQDEGSEDRSDSDRTTTTTTTTVNDSFTGARSMLVARNGGFELQNEDDYIAKTSSNGIHSDSDSHDDSNTPNSNRTVAFLETPATETKSANDEGKPSVSPRLTTPLTRPKSSEPIRRSDFSHSATIKSQTQGNNQTRPKSANLSRMSTVQYLKAPSAIDFAALNQKAAERKRAELREEQRKKEEADRKRELELKKAEEKFARWVRDKDAERKRINDEKRLEQEEREARQVECEKELAELREKKYKEWVERKNREVMMANEFKKLQANEDDMIPGESSSSIGENKKAFNRWLRRKYEQSRDERRQLRREERRLRRRQRRSIKRFQLQQDLQLAKSFGYS